MTTTRRLRVRENGVWVPRGKAFNVVPPVTPGNGFSRTLNDVVYDHFGAPLRTDGLFPTYGKHEAPLPTNPDYDWTHGAKPSVIGPYPNGPYTHHNTWGQITPVATGAVETRVRCHVITDAIFHLLANNNWVLARSGDAFGEIEGAYWSGNPNFTPVLNMSPGTHWRAEAGGGYSFSLQPTVNSDGSPSNSRVAHWFYKGFWPRLALPFGTKSVAIFARMRLIPDAANVDVSRAKFVGNFNGDLFIDAFSSVGPNGINPAFSINRHKYLTGDFKHFGYVGGTENEIRNVWPTIPGLVNP